MSADRTLKVVLCWHMHQPEYRDLRNGEYQLPWTYLHTIKDYVDMAAHLEQLPKARAVVNFAPVLLDQIADYAKQIWQFFNEGIALRDPLLASLVEPALPAHLELRLDLVKAYLRANRERQINRYPPYQRLAVIGDWVCECPDVLAYLDSQFLADLAVWYHLAWLGETVKRSDARVQGLLAKGAGYTLHERRELLGIIGELVGSVINRYRALAERGQVELSVTPYAHPIMPLLLEIQSARQAMPEAGLPLLENYPGGEERVRWHLQRGIESFRHYFGCDPKGCWPSEGSLSEATLRLLSQAGFSWTASGWNVLHNSIAKSSQKEPKCLHQPYRLEQGEMTCFFRDDGLSDLIGFTYSDWHADDAIGDLIHHLEGVAKACKGQSDAIVPIIMDGENAWEHYPENGYHFLKALYERFTSHPYIELTTFSDYLAGKPKVRELPHLVAGSWVYGTFSTWIGDADKNRGWDMLGDAKRCFDRAKAAGKLDHHHLQEAERQLAVCEGSDWFWWFGDYNPAAIVSDFERLFRLNLANLYLLLGEEPPAYLTHEFTHGRGTPLKGGAMRPANPVEA